MRRTDRRPSACAFAARRDSAPPPQHRLHPRRRPGLRRRRIPAVRADERPRPPPDAGPRPPRRRRRHAYGPLRRGACLRAKPRLAHHRSRPGRLLPARQLLRPRVHRDEHARVRPPRHRLRHMGRRQVGRRRRRRVRRTRLVASPRPGVRLLLRLSRPSRRPHLLPLPRPPEERLHGHHGEPLGRHRLRHRHLLHRSLRRKGQAARLPPRRHPSRHALLPLSRRQHHPRIRTGQPHPDEQEAPPRPRTPLPVSRRLVAARARADRNAKHLDRTDLPHAPRTGRPLRNGHLPPRRRAA